MMAIENKENDISGLSWAERGDYWPKKINPIPQYKARKRRLIHRPLVVSGHGIKLNVHCGTLLIKCGFTHYPQQREEYRFFPQDRQLPSRIVILDGDGSITFDALEWLSAQCVPLVQIDWRGEVSYVGGANYAAAPVLVKRQRIMEQNGQGFKIATALILQKIENSYDTIKKLHDNSAEAQTALKKIQERIAAFKKKPPSNISALLSAEGVAAMHYFLYWQTIPLKWKGLGRKPIPPEWLRMGSRRMQGGKSNRSATHPINAILNYVYAVLESQVRAHVLASGYDPTIGFIHLTDNERSALILDLMEPLRPVMDCRVLELITSRTFSREDFILNKDGGCRLHPQFARYIVKLVQDMPEIEKITAANLKKLFG